MIDKSKTYRTRDGREVRIYATDGRYGCEVHGAIKQNNGWMEYTWTITGHSDHIKDNSLIEDRPRHKRTVWLNVYEDCAGVWDSKKEADKYSIRERLACIKVELDFEEGEGL